jgi:hypothetical protein
MAVIIGAVPAPVLGCGGTIDQTVIPPLTRFTVGQDVTIHALFGPIGQSATINAVLVHLDCGNFTGCNAGPCDDKGEILTYLGDASIINNGCSLHIRTVAVANTVLFIFRNATDTADQPIILLGGTTCSFQFGVHIASLDLDGTPKLITGTVETQGTCADQTPLGLCGSYLLALADPHIHIEKTVAPPLALCEGSGGSFTYNYAVTNTSADSPLNDPLSNIVVVDDNGTPGIPGDDFNPTPVDIAPADGFNDGDTNLDNKLDETETWLYTHTRTVASLPVGDTTNTAVVHGDFVNAVGTTTVTDDDPATVTVNPIPSCNITPDPGVCETTYTAHTDGCPTARSVTSFHWTGPGGFTFDGPSITLNGSSLAGDYCVTVTDCNGCQNDPTGCCITFTPPVPPPCEITGGTESVCQGHTTNWCANAGTGLTYVWAAPAGDSTNNGSTARCIDVGTNGEYCVTVTDAAGCTHRCCRTLTVIPPPPCTITGGDTTICSGSTTTWCGPADMDIYAWTASAGGVIPPGQEDDQCITIGTAGHYCLVTTDNGCTSTDTCCRDLIVNQCGGQACSPGYWKQDQHFAAWCVAGFNPVADYCFPGPATLFKDAFNMTVADFVQPLPSGFNPSTTTLLQAVRTSAQGCDKQILFQGTAALLDAAAIPNFQHSVADVQALMKNSFSANGAPGHVARCTAANTFAGWISTGEAQGGCPCNNNGCHFASPAAAVDTIPAGEQAGAVAPSNAPSDAPSATGTNAMCGMGTATLVPFGFVGWTLMGRKRSGKAKA